MNLLVWRFVVGGMLGKIFVNFSMYNFFYWVIDFFELFPTLYCVC